MKHLSQAALFAFVVDQISKVLVVHLMDLKTIGYQEIFPPFLIFQMGWNTGINFGFFSGGSPTGRWVLVAIALVISALVLRWALKDNFETKANISAGLLIGGALANVLDRILYGAVADFLNMSCCGIYNPYSFNLADVFVFAGAIGLIWFTGNKKVG